MYFEPLAGVEKFMVLSAPLIFILLLQVRALSSIDQDMKQPLLQNKDQILVAIKLASHARFESLLQTVFPTDLVDMIVGYADERCIEVQSDKIAIGSAYFWEYDSKIELLKITERDHPFKTIHLHLSYTPSFMICDQIGMRLMLSQSRPPFTVRKEITDELLHRRNDNQAIKIYKIRLSAKKVILNFIWVICLFFLAMTLSICREKRCLAIAILCFVIFVWVFRMASMFSYSHVNQFAQLNNQTLVLNERNPVSEEYIAPFKLSSLFCKPSSKSIGMYSIKRLKRKIALFRNDELMYYEGKALKFFLSIDGMHAAFVEKNTDGNCSLVFID